MFALAVCSWCDCYYCWYLYMLTIEFDACIHSTIGRSLPVFNLGQLCCSYPGATTIRFKYCSCFSHQDQWCYSYNVMILAQMVSTCFFSEFGGFTYDVLYPINQCVFPIVI